MIHLRVETHEKHNDRRRFMPHDGWPGGAIACGIPYVPVTETATEPGEAGSPEPARPTECTTDPRIVTCAACRSELPFIESIQGLIGAGDALASFEPFTVKPGQKARVQMVPQVLIRTRRLTVRDVAGDGADLTVYALVGNVPILDVRPVRMNAIPYTLHCGGQNVRAVTAHPGVSVILEVENHGKTPRDIVAWLAVDLEDGRAARAHAARALPGWPWPAPGL